MKEGLAAHVDIYPTPPVPTTPIETMERFFCVKTIPLFYPVAPNNIYSFETMMKWMTGVVFLEEAS